MSSQRDYKKMYKQLKTENIKLKQTIEIMTQESMEHMQAIEMQGHTIEELKRSVADLKRRLGQHDNFNTPPSMKKRSNTSGIKENSDMPEPKSKQSKLSGKQNGAADSVPKPRGGQTGHKGVTNKPEPTRFEEHTPDTCPGCGLGKLSITKTIKQNITKVVRTITNITTCHSINTCRCNSCGREDIRPETGLSNNGSYDPSIVTEVADCYACRMPFRMIADYMTRHGVTLSSGTAYNIMHRLGASLSTPTADTVAIIRKAKILHIDETSIHLNGHNVWVWILYDPLTEHALYVMQGSRGAKVLRETLGEWDGIIVCDGWSAYNGYRVQRCWSHIIREAKDLWERNLDCPGTWDVLRRLRKIYYDAKKVSKKRSRSLRHRAYANLLARIDRIIARYADDPVLEKFMGKLGNAGSDLFRFVLNPNIPPTNNTAERGLREIVVHRKIRGGIRAKETMTWLANFFSCVMTWKNNKLDYLAEIAKYA